MLPGLVLLIVQQASPKCSADCRSKPVLGTQMLFIQLARAPGGATASWRDPRPIPSLALEGLKCRGRQCLASEPLQAAVKRTGKRHCVMAGSSPQIASMRTGRSMRADCSCGASLTGMHCSQQAIAQVNAGHSDASEPYIQQASSRGEMLRRGQFLAPNGRHETAASDAFSKPHWHALQPAGSCLAKCLALGCFSISGKRTGKRHCVMAGSSPQMASMRTGRSMSSIWCFSHQCRCVFSGSGQT